MSRTRLVLLLALALALPTVVGAVRSVAQEADPPAATAPADPAQQGEGATPASNVPRRIDLNALKQSGADLGSSWGQKVQSLFGMLVLLGVCYAMSKDRSKVAWRLVGWGVALQLILGVLVMKTPVGRTVFSKVNDIFVGLIGFTTEGSTFLFGNLAKQGNVPVGEGWIFGPVQGTGTMAEVGAYFAFGVLPTIIFFSSLMAVLYHVGAMQLVVKGVAWVMQRTMGTSGSETLSASGNIFVGQTEAPLLVRPFVKGMTESELMAVMTAGFATVAGGVMAAYVGMLQASFQDIAGHLLAASVMSAPAALVCAKLMIPEPDPTKSETYGELKVSLEKIDVNVIDAAARGAADGLKLALNVGAMLLAFIALIAMLNWGIGYLASFAGVEGLTLQKILGVVLSPVAWLMGVPWEDAGAVGRLIGVKTVVNEFVAYGDLAGMLAQPEPAFQHPRSVVIAVYALCGFANFSSIAIQIGGIGGIAPERRGDLSRLGLKAMIAGTIACMLTATVAGLLI